MATAVFRRAVVILLAAQLFCRGDDPEICGQTPSPWTELRNHSFQCGVVIEDDLPGDQVGLLQVEVHIGHNTKDAALSNAHLGFRVNSSVATGMALHSNTSLLSSSAKVVRKLSVGSGHQPETAATAEILIVIGLICVGGVTACMIMGVFQEGSDVKTSPNTQRQGQQRAINSPRFVDLLARSSVKPAPASAPLHRSSSKEPSLTHGGQQEGAAAPGSGRLADRLSPQPGQQRSALQTSGASTPRGRVVSNQIASGAPSRLRSNVIPTAAPAIAPSLVMPNCSVFLTVPMKEIIGISQPGHAQKLDIFTLKGKAMFSGKVDTTLAGGQPTFAISSVGGKGEVPRVYIRPRGRGLAETLDVLGPRGDVYGALTYSGDSIATLRYHDRPIMKIKKVNDLPTLEMQATTMDCKGIANAGWKGGDSWKLTVEPGADAVLICACMIGLIIFGGGNE